MKHAKNTGFSMITCLESHFRHFSKKKEHFSCWVVYWISWALSKIVADLHKNRIIHRDIKPANIILDCDLVPHLIDFGESTAIGKDGNKLSITTYLHGTLNYAAPEIFNGGKHSIKTDIYSLGGTIFTLVAHKMPFEDFLYGNEPLSSFRFLTDDERSLLRNFSESLPLYFENAQNVLKKKIEKEGISDQSFSYDSEKFQKLPKCLQELIMIVSDCWNKKQKDRPDAEKVAESIMEASKYLGALEQDKFLANVLIFNKKLYRKGDYGDIENVERNEAFFSSSSQISTLYSK